MWQVSFSVITRFLCSITGSQWIPRAAANTAQLYLARQMFSLFSAKLFSFIDRPHPSTHKMPRSSYRQPKLSCHPHLHAHVSHFQCGCKTNERVYSSNLPANCPSFPSMAWLEMSSWWECWRGPQGSQDYSTNDQSGSEQRRFRGRAIGMRWGASQQHEVSRRSAGSPRLPQERPLAGLRAREVIILPVTLH